MITLEAEVVQHIGHLTAVAGLHAMAEKRTVIQTLAPSGGANECSLAVYIITSWKLQADQ